MQTNQTIFVVLSAHDHEGASAVKAFFNKDDATAFARECGIYDTTVECCPPNEDSAENDALWEAWTLRNDEWNKAHPAGEYGQADYYPVYEIPISPAALLSAPTLPVELTESELMKCIAQAGCFGTVKLSYESGPYYLDRPTLNATKLARAILAAARAQPVLEPQCQHANGKPSYDYWQCTDCGMIKPDGDSAGRPNGGWFHSMEAFCVWKKGITQGGRV